MPNQPSTSNLPDTLPSAPAVGTPPPGGARLPDLAAVLRLFDETTAALAAQVRRLEDVLVAKQQELVAANSALAAKVAERDRLAAYLDLVMGAVASGVIAVDRAGRITTCNPAARTILAHELGEPLGADHATAFPGSPLQRLLTGASAVGGYERSVRGEDGGRRVLAVRASPLRDATGTLLGAVEVFDDVTEVRRLQESVERADRLQQLGEMAAGVAHEIRNPLTGITGFASLLARDLPAADPRHRFAEAIVAGVATLNRTVSGLLEFTQPRRLARTAVDPHALAASCLDLVESELAVRADTPAPTLVLDDRWPGGAVLCDGTQLRQVLLNLVQNAVHALAGDTGMAITGVDSAARRAVPAVPAAADQAPPRRVGNVRLTIEPTSAEEEPGIAFTVDDDGPGVPAAARQRIFTPFYTTKDHGTGLGLAVSHAIVSLHGGTIGVEDSPLGGARFRVAIPL